MGKLKMFLIVPAAILAVACGRDDSKKVDDALNADLTLAAQARPYTAMDSISANCWTLWVARRTLSVA